MAPETVKLPENMDTKRKNPLWPVTLTKNTKHKETDQEQFNYMK